MLYGLFGLLFDCAPGTTETADTAVSNVFLTSVEITCNDDDNDGVDSWHYGLSVWGDPGEAHLYVERFGGTVDDAYGETHRLFDPVYNAGLDEFRYDVELRVVSTEEQVIDGQTTLIPCGTRDTNWRVRLFDAADRYSQCSVFGEDVSLLLAEDSRCVELQMSSR
jgi:hypothetical protein